jgi:hypothetical protein
LGALLIQNHSVTISPKTAKEGQLAQYPIKTTPLAVTHILHKSEPHG